MTREELTRIVEEEVRKALGGGGAAEPVPPSTVASAPSTAASAPSTAASAPSTAASAPSTAASTPVPARRPRNRIARWLEDPADSAEPPRRRSLATQPPADTARLRAGIEEPANPARLSALVASTPSRIGVGRAGVRYRTETYLALRADHAVAKDAVYSEAEDALIEKLGCLALKTRCESREDFLLHPARGRRLDDASMARLAAEGTKGAQIQVILADGLSAWAAARNGPELLPLLQTELTSAGFSVGRPLFVRFARVGVQDPIGVALGNRATAICLGERPGLGTGDSLSIYLAYGPELDQDNAKKNCISNVRAMGIRPPEAAREAVEILRRAFAAGRGGVAL